MHGGRGGEWRLLFFFVLFIGYCFRFLVWVCWEQEWAGDLFFCFNNPLSGEWKRPRGASGILVTESFRPSFFCAYPGFCHN